MKLVKKLLRLFPLISLICFFVSIVFNKIGYDTPTDLVNFFSWETGFYDTLLETYSIMIPQGIYDWFTTYISGNYYLVISISILFYELYLSIAFIMFDFINIIFSWTNKLIDKGGINE